MAADGHFDNIELQDNAIYETTMDTPQEKDPQKILQSDILRRYKRAGVGVGLLCAVLALLTIAIPLHLYQSNMVEREELLMRYNKLTKEQDDLKKWFCSQKDVHLKKSLCESYGFTFDFNEDLCYYISNAKKTWEDSRQWCRDKQSDLIVIKSKNKQDFVGRVNDKRVWMGLTDRDEEGRFQWVDGTPLTTPTYWLPDEPDHEIEEFPNAEEDCIEFYVGPNGPKGWSDILCSSVTYWICERVLC